MISANIAVDSMQCQYFKFHRDCKFCDEGGKKEQNQCSKPSDEHFRFDLWWSDNMKEVNKIGFFDNIQRRI